MNVFYVNVILCFEALATDIGPTGRDGLILLSVAALSLVLTGHSTIASCPLLPHSKCFSCTSHYYSDCSKQPILTYCPVIPKRTPKFSPVLGVNISKISFQSGKLKCFITILIL